MKILTILCKSGLIGIAVWAATFLGSTSSFADEVISDDSIGQVNSVSQLRDVSPGDWAFEALRNLVERYGCIAGFPNGTYRGNRPLTRYEFAAGLNACLSQIERLIAASGSNVGNGDLATIQRLAQEFEGELATLGTRVDNLEDRVGVLEDNQFSTTTKLEGEVLFAVANIFSGDDADGNEVDRVPFFGNRVRLRLSTSFTGDDLLFIRLATGNIPELSEQTGTFQSELGFAQPDDNDLAIDVLLYELPINKNARLWILPAGGAADDFTDTLNFLDGDGDAGALSAFGTRNPIYFPVENTGVGFKGQLGNFELSAGYLATLGNEPSSGSGLFNGPFSAIAQLGYKPNDNFGVAFTYVHGFNNLDTGTGTSLSNFQTFTEDLFGEAVSTVNDSYGVEFTWQVADKLVLGGWGGFTRATTLDTLDGQIERGSLDILNWAVTMGFPDLLKEGSTAGIIVGMQPWVSRSSIDLGELRNEDDDISLHIEAFYEYLVTDNIRITPGVIVITSPDSNSSNSTLVIGTIRTNFSF